MATIKINGIEELQAKLKKNVTMNDVKTVVQHNGELLENNMVRQAVFGRYAEHPTTTGDTARSITLRITDSGFTATVAPETEYSPYVEYGTRFMQEQPFVRPAFDMTKTKFLDDLKKLCK